MLPVRLDCFCACSRTGRIYGKEAVTTGRRLKRLIREEERTAAKIAELQEYLKEIRQAKKAEEDSEILKSIRGLKLGTWELYNMLTGIQDGTVSMEARVPAEGDDGEDAPADGPAAEPEETGQDNKTGETPDEGEGTPGSGLPAGQAKPDGSRETGEGEDGSGRP